MTQDSVSSLIAAARTGDAKQQVALRNVHVPHAAEEHRAHLTDCTAEERREQHLQHEAHQVVDHRIDGRVAAEAAHAVRAELHPGAHRADARREDERGEAWPPAPRERVLLRLRRRRR